MRKNAEIATSHRELPWRRVGVASALMITVASAAWADVPSELQAGEGGAPPGYYDPVNPDGDGLVSYNDPFKGQSDAALKAKIAPIQQTTLRNISNLTNIGGKSDGVPVRGTKSTQWKSVIRGRDSFGGPATDAITGRTNYGSEEFIGDAFFATVDTQRWNRFVEETSARRERLEDSIQEGVSDVRRSINSTVGGTDPTFDGAAYEQLDRDLELLESDIRRERNILQDELKTANDRFLSTALYYEQQMNDEEKAFWQNAIFITASAGVGAVGVAAGGMTSAGGIAFTETGSGIAFAHGYTIADVVAVHGLTAVESVVFMEAVIATMGRMAGPAPVKRSALEKMKLAQAPIKAVKGAYDASIEDIQRLEQLRGELGQAKQIHRSLYHRRTGIGLNCKV